MKLWILDADVIIDLLSLDLFESLIAKNEVHVATTVIGEVKSFKKGEGYQEIDFRSTYVETGKVTEHSASIEEIKETVISKLPTIWQQTIHMGELESLAILAKEEDCIFCCCDSATIRTLPFIDASERGISVERLISATGLKRIPLEPKHTEEYFQNNLKIGKTRRIQDFKF